MDYTEALILGLVQGLGEFLPISSSGHLIVVPWLLGQQDQGQVIDVALHFGTLIALLLYFKRDWIELCKSGVTFLLCKNTSDVAAQENKNLLCCLIIGTIPAAIIGKLLEKWVEHHLRIPLLVATDMIILGVLLLLADRRHGKKNLSSINWKMALIIGLAQSFALVPGVSRSGATITAALFLGFTRADAARFSFLLSAPIILGAILLKTLKADVGIFTTEALFGVFIAFVSGYLSIKYLLKLVQASSYLPFCWYRFGFGTIVILTWLIRVN